jgi:putative toxin-antitoxin system antitoxin component (TIGR02293 family)
MKMKKQKTVKYPDLDTESFSEESLMTVAENGIAYGVFNQITNQIPLTVGDWADYLHLSERTLHRYRKNKLKFDPLHSERILELVLLFRKGAKIFGTLENYFTWLNTKNISLGSKLPKSMLGSSVGIQLLKDELSRIEHGVLA